MCVLLKKITYAQLDFANVNVSDMEPLDHATIDAIIGLLSARSQPLNGFMAILLQLDA